MLTGSGNHVCCHNMDAGGRVSFRFDGTTAVLDAEGTYGVGKQAGAHVKLRHPVRGSLTISAIADAATRVVFWLED